MKVVYHIDIPVLLSLVIVISGFRIEEATSQVRETAAPPPIPTKPPLSDAEFHLYLDAVGRLVQPQQFRIAVYQSGVESSLRPVVWRHLLNVYPGDMSGRERFEYVRRKSNEYYRLRDEWRTRESTDPNVQMVAGMVRKDVHRTDRLHAFYAGENNPNGTALFNLLVTFALTHPQLSYWQGMSDIVSPILVVQADEAAAYICFCALMRRLGSSFAADGGGMSTRFRQLALLVRHFDAEFYGHICRCSASDMFFTYRWLLLEMKREFPLDDAMYALEVMWSSLPLDPPNGDLQLFDVAYLDSGAFTVSPVASHTEAYVHLRSSQRRLSEISSGNSVPASQGNQKPNGTVTKITITPPTGQRVVGTVIGESDESRIIVGNSKTTKVNESIDKSIISCSTKSEGISRDTTNRSAVDESDDDVLLTSKSIISESIQGDDADVEDSDEQTKLLEPSENLSLDYVKVSRAGTEILLPPLPPPSELGCGNPFLMFICLSTLLLQRNRVMATCVDYNDIAMHYDKMARQHRVEHVIHYARQLYATYLKRLQSQKDDMEDEHANSF